MNENQKQANRSSEKTSENAPEPLRSVHTDNFPELLSCLDGSLLITTYQARKLIIARANGQQLNTHFRCFHQPMGLAYNGLRLSIGDQGSIVEFRNQPQVADKLEPPNKHDACFLPRRSHFTGDIDIHEMHFDEQDTLWFINTRFSCLCTLDDLHSFVPRWRPHFISGYSPEDRCHLNGLSMRDGKPKYVTALGTTDTNQGWRDRKADGGVLMDIESNEIISSGLSMPHSPRWYNGKLWLLESGDGSIGHINLQTGKYEKVAELPGFTRGVHFVGPLAFIGLSQVRESAVFSGIPITKRLNERICGVWVVNIETGQTVAFLRFEDAIQEIFAVTFLEQIQYPELINDDPSLIGYSYVLPDEAMKDVQQPSTKAA